MISALRSSRRIAAAARPATARACSTLGEAGKVAVNGINLHYLRNGSSGPPVVCLPGAMGTAETDFAPQLRSLSETMQVVSFDPRGYGQSRPPRRDFPVDFYQQDADDAAALMEALGHTEYNVVGWSDGSIAAVLLAAKQKKAVGKLVIFGGNAFFTKEGMPQPRPHLWHAFLHHGMLAGFLPHSMLAWSGEGRRHAASVACLPSPQPHLFRTPC